MKRVMHQVSMHCTYATTEAMTTAHVQVFYMLCIFKPQATQICTVTIDYNPISRSYICQFGTKHVVCGRNGFSSDACMMH